MIACEAINFVTCTWPLCVSVKATLTKQGSVINILFTVSWPTVYTTVHTVLCNNMYFSQLLLTMACGWCVGLTRTMQNRTWIKIQKGGPYLNRSLELSFLVPLRPNKWMVRVEWSKLLFSNNCKTYTNKSTNSQLGKIFQRTNKQASTDVSWSTWHKVSYPNFSKGFCEGQAMKSLRITQG